MIGLRTIALFLIGFFSCFQSIAADDVACAGCNCKRKTSDDWHFIGRFAIDPDDMSSWYSTSFLLEAGSKHFRGNGTLGLLIGDIDRFKVTGEWLIQKNSYGFCARDANEWINQGAVGVAYQHLFCNPYILSFDMGGAYSHAFSRKLGIVPCSNQSLVRRYIAGSNAYDVSFGTTIFSWCEGLISIYATYDRLIYIRKFFPDVEINGFGGGAKIFQPLSSEFDITAFLEIRQPYNYYEADINFRGTYRSYNYTLGLFASYTDGKKYLTNQGQVGIQLNFLLGDNANSGSSSNRRSACDFASWVRTPAVYRPKVLAIKDQDCIMTCAAPYPIISILDALVFSGEESQLDGGLVFFGSDLSYSLNNNVPTGVTIDPETGLISIPSSLVPGVYNFRIQGTNLCGLASAPVVLSVVEFD